MNYVQPQGANAPMPQQVNQQQAIYNPQQSAQAVMGAMPDYGG